MLNLVLLGLIACCLLGLLVIAYLVRALEQLLRRQQAAPTTATDDAARGQLTASESVADAAGARTTGATASLHANDDAREEDGAGVDASRASDASGAGGAARVASGVSYALAPDVFVVMSPEAAPAGSESESDIYAAALNLEGYFNQSAHPKDLLQHDEFRRGVELLSGARYTGEDLLNYAGGANTVLSCMSLEALARRADGREWSRAVLDGLNNFYWWPRYYALRMLDAHAGAEDSLAGEVVARLEATWAEAVLLRFLREFVGWRAERGERMTFGAHLEGLSEERAEAVSEVLNALGADAPAGLLEEFRAWR
ncbi:MAG TPA: hypothetical protein VEQ42_04825, partial [Pyrinomonadaceae bacterium]|nr:hypothetical protein [Pyrinomonadaceae bacterium]